jgi:hypothetical protein
MRAIVLLGVLGFVPAANASFIININSGAGLSGNVAAVAAFSRAADTWEALFSDNITININADLAALGSGTIGSTTAVSLSGGYTTIRNAMAAEGVTDATRAIMASLPTAAQFVATVPPSFSLSGNTVLTKANAKALGFAGLDGLFGASDGTITFSSLFSFDYDNSNGVTPGTMDFETVATHEIGHLLGFVSVVDHVDATLATPSAISMTPLDLYRFASGGAPTLAAQFSTAARNFVPGASAVFSDSVLSYSMSTGVAHGDGHQASHWKDDNLTSTYIGIMDPTLSLGVQEAVTAADIRAMSLIGYNLAPQVPEPGTVALMFGGGIFLLIRRRRQ